MPEKDPTFEKSGNPLLAVFLIVSIALVLGFFGYYYFRTQIYKVKLDHYAGISAIAHLKYGELQQWRSERISDADFFSSSPAIKSMAWQIRNGNDTLTMHNQFISLLSRMSRNHRYENILLTDHNGRIMLSLVPEGSQLDSTSMATLQTTLKEDKIVFGDLHYSKALNRIHLDVIAPVHLDEGSPAVLVFCINPKYFLYPLIQSWPSPSKTSETIIVRKEGDSVLFLNEIRHEKNTALRLKFPLSREDLPAVKALKGDTGMISGRDYRGVKVFADVRPVKGTSWFMIAKIDTREVYADMITRFVLLSILMAMLVSIIAISFALAYNSRQKATFLQLFLKEKELRVSQEEIVKFNQELENRVETRTEQLKTANQELEAFAYTVSHDLRTPLRAIDGFSAILAEDYGDRLDEEGVRITRVIRQNAQKMGKLIDELLNFSRLGRSDMMNTPIDMRELAENSFEELVPAENRQNMKFNMGNLHPVSGDPGMIRQVWMNLFSNAIKFSSHRRNPEISVGSRMEDYRVIYTVLDNGAGFDMKYADKLFGVFHRLHGENEFEGTGVGLAIVHRIVTRHGGSVWAEGQVDKGASFSFSLPK